jgi:hypothetical protein
MPVRLYKVPPLHPSYLFSSSSKSSPLSVLLLTRGSFYRIRFDDGVNEAAGGTMNAISVFMELLSDLWVWAVMAVSVTNW